ncbi:MAG: GNAT family N-acetyltransferase [Verrucomicrobia bacterium]|nr:GNAT family N-acetyltransferase [Verrucomicrobiota bacterium]
MNIRVLQFDDWQQWKDLRKESILLSPTAFASSFEEEAGLADRQFQDWITKNVIFGAFQGDQLIGTAGFFQMELAKEKHRGVLFSVYVTPHERQQGIAHQLVEHVIQEAKKRVIQLHLKVVSSNASAVHLYQRHGFEVYGTELRSLKYQDRFFNEYLMVLRFD